MSDKPSRRPASLNAVPVLPLRDVVVFPHMVIPLFVGRDKSMHALDAAMQGDRRIALVAQKNAEVDDPGQDDLYEVGTMASILQLLKLPDGTIKVLVEGHARVHLEEMSFGMDMLRARATELRSQFGREPRELEVASRTLVTQFENMVKSGRKLPPEVLSALSGIDDPSRLADTVAAHLSVRMADKQRALETLPVGQRLELLVGLVEAEMDLQKVEKRIRGRVKSQMEKSQREYYLNEQMKAIQKELSDEDGPDEYEELEARIESSGMPGEVAKKARRELKKLKQMAPMAAEAAVVRNYLDWLLGVPWQERSEVSKDLPRAGEILDADHYGLERVKERILEYLAVQQRVDRIKGPILCLVGPPGVGKTSLGQSIARATGRDFVRMSLGGVRDEAEIRGHRRTYIGSMPGRIIQNLSKTGTRNPLFMLDEIDKMTMDFRGDPSSALLEVLDPEQNSTFADHYLEVDFDLSEVMWIATANSLNIPGPLLDRMEVIRLPGYTEHEKLSIAKRYLVPKQLEANGLKTSELKLTEAALRDIVRHYTRESGVRSLEREIAKVSRKVVKELSMPDSNADTGKPGKRKAVQVSIRNLEHYLGVQKFDFGRAERQSEVGLVTGLAWTQVGGDLLSIEAAVVPGKGKLLHTGQLGEVMQESIQAALSVTRARAERFGIAPDFHETRDIHIHVPEGATPKDGPSAGIGMCTALVSALTGIAVRSEVAMTGEITLRGRVLPIGGLKEKLLAALRGGITTVIIPEDNRKNLVDMPEEVTDKLDIHPVRWIDEVLDIALEAPLTPRKAGKDGLAAGKTIRGAGQADRPARPH